MKAYSTKRCHSVINYKLLSEKKWITFPGYPKYKIREITWRAKNIYEEDIHRYYLYTNNSKQYVGDMIGNDGFVRVSNDYVYICTSNGHEELKYKIK